MIYLGMNINNNKMNSKIQECVNVNILNQFCHKYMLGSFKEYTLGNYKLFATGDRTNILNNNDLLVLTQGYVFDQNDKILSLREILELYKNKRKEFVKDITGTFRMVILDKAKNRLILISDFMNVYPIYYCVIGEQFIFSNKYCLIAKIIKNKITIDKIGVSEFLQFGHFLNNRTHFNEIKRLGHGSLLEFSHDTKKREIIKYKKLSFSEKERDFDTCIEKFDFLLSKSIKKIIPYLEEHELCLPLSGGLDSRMLLVLLLRHTKESIKINTYTFGDKKCLDFKIANKISSLIGTNHHNIDYKLKNFRDMFDDMCFYTDYFGDIRRVHTINMYFNIKKNHSNPLVILGAGGDALTGAHLRCDLLELDDDAFFNKLYNISSLSISPSERKNLLNKKYFNYSEDLVFADFLRIFEECDSSENYDRATYYDLTQRQGQWIMNIVKELAFNFVNVMTPFYSEEFVDFTLSLPRNLKKNQKLYKHIFLKKHKMLARIVSTSGYLNDNLLKKFYFQYLKRSEINDLMFPYTQWYKNELKNHTLGLLANMESNFLYNEPYLKKIVSMHLQGKKDYSWILSSILTIENLFKFAQIKGDYFND